jgi:hypothetical protein
MRILKVALAVLLAFAGYKAYKHFVLGIPADPEQALTEWSLQANAGVPKKLTDTITLTGVRLDWHDPKGISNVYDEKVARWIEQYEVAGQRDASTLDQAKDRITDEICRSQMHGKVMALMNIELVLKTPTQHVSVDPATAFRMGSPVVTQYPIEKTVVVGQASCAGR